MTCSYCGSRNNDETVQRCRRCGRRPGDTLNAGFAVHRTTGALANKLRPGELPDQLPTMRIPTLSGPIQGNLFTPNVVAMPSRGVSKKTGTRPRTAAASDTTGSRPGTKRARPRPEGQGELDFFTPAPIYCDAPVATPLHRALAAAIDWTMVLFAYGLFLLPWVLFGGQFVINRSNVMIFGGALALVAGAYGLFWIVAGTESAGMRWTHLRLITFDGFPPDTWQRVARFAGMCLSLFSVLGVLWSVADEEGLGWQDHISRTFPTADDLESRVFRRR